MKVKKISNKNKLNKFTELKGYDHYIALDWSQDQCAIGRISGNRNKPKVILLPPRVEEVKRYLNKLRGRKVLMLEETTSTHWLYVELLDYVDKIIVCDPYRNSLLSEGAKNDKIDTGKLCMILKGGLYKEVYHNMSDGYNIRKLVSSYEDLIRAGVRIKNQKSALYRALGKHHKKNNLKNEDEILKFIEERQNESIELYLSEKEKYQEEFNKIYKKNDTVKRLCGVSGIGVTSAVKTYAMVLDARRFPTKNKYWSYCGLVQHEKESGYRKYGKKKTRYSRIMKKVYDNAALAAIGGKNDIKEYYDYLLENGYSDFNARHSAARYIAKVTYAMMKNDTNYIPYSWRKK